MTTPTPQAPPASPSPATSAAQIRSETDSELRLLAAEIAKASKLGFDPSTIRKATISAVNDSSTPPTVSLNISGDTETLISQVRLLNNYTPLVGQTVLLVKQGAEIFILGSIAGANALQVPAETGWQKATLAAGSHGGNSNGDVYFRRVLDHGTWKMQWRGGWNVSGTQMISALDPDFRPSSRRSVLVARQIAGGSNVAQLDFNSDGSVNLIGATTTAGANGGHSHGVSVSVSGSGSGSGSTGVSGSLEPHTHSVSTSDSFFGSGSGSSDYIGSHTHSVSSPTWISLNGVEYFL